MEMQSFQETYKQVTNNIAVIVTPEFLPERSEPSQNIFAFAYTVRIENLGESRIQLVNRHWRVISGDKQIADVKGEGVVGEQPSFEPGEVFEYSSWTIIYAPYGAMLGSYTFVSEDGEFFDVEIPEFSLIHIDENSIH